MKGRSLTRVPSKHKCLSIFYEWPSRSIKEESGYQGCPVSGPSSELMRHLQGWEQLLEWASIDSFRATTKLLPNIIHLSTVMVGDGSPIWIFMEKKGGKNTVLNGGMILEALSERRMIRQVSNQTVLVAMVLLIVGYFQHTTFCTDLQRYLKT